MRRALLPLVLALAGCPMPPAQRPGPPPTAQQLVDHINQRATHLPLLRTEAKVDYLAEKGDRIKLTMTFITRAPDGLRIDAENPMGGTVASLASDGNRFQLLDARQNRFLTGEAKPCNIARLLRVQLTAADVVQVIDGGVPLLGAPVKVDWDPNDGGHEVLILKDDAGRTETIKLAPKIWDVVSAEVTGADGKVLYRLTHEEFSDENGQRFPGKSWIFDPAHAADVKIRYRSREVSPTVPEGVFHLDAPNGIPAEEVTCN
jgi:hypothetical protein